MLVLAIALAATISSPQTQSEMTRSSYRAQQNTERMLAAEWKKAQAWAAEQDKDLDRSYDKRPTYSAQLLKAQRAWISYKESHCEVEAWAARGGSMEPMLLASCIDTLSKERIRQLKNLRISLEG